MVRNFYVSGNVDGRNTSIGAGPARKDGGMALLITQRDAGEIVNAFAISSRVRDGKLITTVWDSNGKMVAEKITER